MCTHTACTHTCAHTHTCTCTHLHMYTRILLYAMSKLHTTSEMKSKINKLHYHDIVTVLFLGRQRRPLYCFYFHRKCPERPERCQYIYIYICQQHGGLLGGSQSRWYYSVNFVFLGAAAGSPYIVFIWTSGV